MRMSLPPKHYIANCSGQRCPERAECLRYMRSAQFPRRDYKTGEMQLQAWASYDIERQAKLTCPAKIEPHPGIGQALLKAA